MRHEFSIGVALYQRRVKSTPSSKNIGVESISDIFKKFKQRRYQTNVRRSYWLSAEGL